PRSHRRCRTDGNAPDLGSGGATASETRDRETRPSPRPRLFAQRGEAVPVLVVAASHRRRQHRSCPVSSQIINANATTRGPPGKDRVILAGGFGGFPPSGPALPCRTLSAEGGRWRSGAGIG